MSNSCECGLVSCSLWFMSNVMILGILGVLGENRLIYCF